MITSRTRKHKPFGQKKSRLGARKNSHAKWRRSARVERANRIDERVLRKVARSVLGGLLHHKQVLSVALVTLGAIYSTRMTIHALGATLAGVRGGYMKHGVKQVDRFLSNPKIHPHVLQKGLVWAVVGGRRRIEVSMDWTDFAQDDHTTLALSLILRHGRAIPLVWLTVKKSTLENQQRSYELETVRRLREALPKHVHFTVIADRGFGSTVLYDHLLGIANCDFIIRFQQKIFVNDGQRLKKARVLVPRDGSIRVLRRTRLTAKQVGPYTVVLYHATRMKDSWCLATSRHHDDGRQIVDAYSRRFDCEESFRDLKDWRYGLALKHTAIKNEARRDRIIFAFALAAFLLTIVGIHSERLGCDRYLRANTCSRRTHSLFRQGREVIACATPNRLIQNVLQAALRALEIALSDGFYKVMA